LDPFDCDLKADADGSNLAPLAKFIARQQLHAYFLCKTREPVVRQQSSEFRYLRIEEAHKFIQQKASDVAETYNKKVKLTDWAPSLTVVSTFSDCAILTLTQVNIAFA